MADTQNSVLELSDEDFMKQGGSYSSAAIAADAAGSQDDEAEAKRLADEEAAQATAATENKDVQGDKSDDAGSAAAKAADGEGTDGQGKTKEDKADDVVPSDNVNTDANATDKDGKTRDADGKFTKPEDKQNKDKPAGQQEPTGKETEGQQQATTIDYKAEYEKLIAPFKANGRDIRVENVDEAVRLMQMGANYNRKMAALKPNLAIMKSLENNGLLTPEKINFLIDLDKKNPEAISKLIKDSGIDPLDISADKAGQYKPGNHSANETEVDLDNVLDEIKDSSKFNETLDLVGKQWDTQSRQIIASQPQLLKVINGHMESGIFDLVAAELERKKLFGQMQGLSDLEAYRQVGDEMASSGKFDHLTKKTGQSSTPGQQTPAVKTIVNPAPKKADDSKREEQRRAAAPNKTAAPAGKLPADFNPLSLSDDEFAKFKPSF